MQRSLSVSSRTAFTRVGWLVLLTLVSLAVVFPQPLNWTLAQAERVMGGVNLPRLERPFVLGLDLRGGAHLEYKADVSRVPDADRKEALEGVRDVIERRVNSLGVSEPLVQVVRAGDDWRVNVEIAGVSVTSAIHLINETPRLEFKVQNVTSSRELTAEEQKQILEQNTAAKKTLQNVLKQAVSGADFAELATRENVTAALKASAGEVGFLQHAPAYADLLNHTNVSTTPVGKVVSEIIERPHSYAIVKIEERKNVPVEVSAHHLLIACKEAEAYTTGTTSMAPLNTRSCADAKTLIQEIKTKATVKNFDDLVAQYSDEPEASTTHGDLGSFRRGAMVPGFEDAVFSQAVHTISPVVETPFGYHLIWKQSEKLEPDLRVRVIETKRLVKEDLVPIDPWQDTKLTGKQLQSARVEFDPQTGMPVVSLQFNQEGADLFARLTRENLGKRIAIFVDGELLSSPEVQSEILGGRAQISGRFSLDEAKGLARSMQSGALPVPVELIAQQSIGPTLGADSLQRSLTAGLAGFALVALFMILLYRLPGLISIVALAIYAALSAAMFKLIPVTMSLSGIAGFILSLGIAVDANVLVYERLKEEFAEGKDLISAFEDAFRRAWPSVRDGHVTVLISCVVLYGFSSSLIKGFALTLAIGTIISLFTAVVSTRTMLRALIRTSLARFGWIFLQKRP